MSEQELDAAVIKATQQSLGKYIKKPPLTEKLLKKPPFRYLMDVFNAFIKQTGCFEGLYTPEEQLFENISDRYDKTRFLQKMIDITNLTTKLDLKVRTSKIVAGQEPRLTNELLQAMASVAEQELEWRAALQQVLASDMANKSKESNSKPKDVRTTSKQISPTVREKPTITEKAKTRTTPTEKEKTRTTPNEQEKTRTTPTENQTRRRTEKEVRPKLSSRQGSKKTPSPTVKPTAKLKQQVSSESEIKSLSPAPVKLASPVSSAPVKAETRSEAVMEAPKDRLVAAVESPNVPSKLPPKESPKEPAPEPTPEPDVQPESRKSSGKSRRSSASQRQAAPHVADAPPQEASELSFSSPTNLADTNNKNNEVKREREGTFTRESSKDSNGSVTRPRTSLRPPSARPASARPGAPRRRNVEIVLQPNDQIKMSGINVKLETFGDLDDDGENLVIIEDAHAHDIELGGSSETQLELDAHQGRLVQQILETQKELVQQHGTDSGKEELQQKQASGARQSSARQVNDLRDIIQTLTKSVNPLGKLMDFIPEDIDAMQLELTMWRDTYTQSATELKRERSLTASATEPMKQQLLTIEASIEEYKELVDESRHKILQSNERILKMLMEQ